MSTGHRQLLWARKTAVSPGCLCALHHGGFAVTYDSDEVNLEASDQDAGLIFVLMRLFERLRPIGTVPAIDLHVWGKSIERTTPTE